MPNIIERLIDSEEHAVEAAVPPVAEEAAETLEQATNALQTAKTLIAEAMASHIYDSANGERPEPGCAFAAGIVTIDQVLRRIGPQTRCDECGSDIPDLHPSCVNDYHADNCSLHPQNTAAAPPRAAALHPFTVLLMKPDYLADNYGEDTALIHVDAATAAEAATEAQAHAFAHESAVEDDGSPDDFAVVLLIAGTHFDLKGE